MRHAKHLPFWLAITLEKAWHCSTRSSRLGWRARRGGHKPKKSTEWELRRKQDLYHDWFANTTNSSNDSPGDQRMQMSHHHQHFPQSDLHLQRRLTHSQLLRQETRKPQGPILVLEEQQRVVDRSLRFSRTRTTKRLRLDQAGRQRDGRALDRWQIAKRRM